MNVTITVLYGNRLKNFVIEVARRATKRSSFDDSGPHVSRNDVYVTGLCRMETTVDVYDSSNSWNRQQNQTDGSSWSSFQQSIQLLKLIELYTTSFSQSLATKYGKLLNKVLCWSVTSLGGEKTKPIHFYFSNELQKRRTQYVTAFKACTLIVQNDDISLLSICFRRWQLRSQRVNEAYTPKNITFISLLEADSFRTRKRLNLWWNRCNVS